jgi:hypothetical protein
MSKRKDYGPLLGMKDGKARPVRRCRKEISPAIRLPSLARLLEIDKQAEAAATASRIAVDASRRGIATSDTKSRCDAGERQLGDKGR